MNATTLRTLTASVALAAATGAPANTVHLNKNAEWSADANAFSSASYWGDGSAAPGPGNDYIVANGRTLRVPDSAATFAGDSLQIGEAGGTSGRLKITGNATKQTFASLVLANGSCTDDRNGNKSEIVAGPVTVTAPADAPFIWSGSPTLNATYSGVYFEGAVSSASDAKIVFADNGQPDYHVNLQGSLAALEGTIEMRTSRSGFYEDSAGGARIVLYPGSGASMPGALAFTAGTSLYPSDKTVDFSIGTLRMEAGSRIRVIGDSSGAHSVFRVTDSFSFPAEDGGIFLEVSGLYKSADTLRAAIFSAPVSSGFTARTFRTAADDGAAALPRYTLECEDTDGIRTLFLVTKIVDPVNPSSTQNNCLNAPSMWASGVLSTDASAANHDFFANKWIKTSNVTGDKSFQSSATLTLGGAATLAIENPRISVSEFGLLHGSKIVDDGYYYNTADAAVTAWAASGKKTVRGTIRAPWKNWETASLVGRAGAWLFHDGTLSGGGIVHLHNAPGTYNAYYQLGGVNTGFFGALKLGTDSAGTGKACLVIDDDANLGGPCKAYRADALTLATGWMLWARASMSLAEPTRGITVLADGVVNTDADVTMSIDESILWNGGGIEKSGAGLLALGGAAMVATGSGATAALTVSEGAFKPLSTNALAGVSLVFGSGTSLKIAVPAANEGMGKRGVSPASVSLPQGGIPVEFDVDLAALSSLEFSRTAILTVALEDAPQIRAGLEVAHSIAGFNVQLGQVDNDDGSATLFAWFGKGTVMIFR